MNETQKMTTIRITRTAFDGTCSNSIMVSAKLLQPDRLRTRRLVFEKTKRLKALVLNTSRRQRSAKYTLTYKCNLMQD